MISPCYPMYINKQRVSRIKWQHASTNKWKIKHSEDKDKTLKKEDKTLENTMVWCVSYKAEKCKGCKSAKFFGSQLKNHLRKCKRKWITKKLAEKNPKTMLQIINTVHDTTRSSTKPYYTINGEHFNQTKTAEMLNQFFSTVGGAASTTTTQRPPPTHPLSSSPGQVKKWLK